MIKFVPILAIALLAFILFTGVSVGDLWNKYRPVIIWSPEKVEQDQFPGTVKVITAKFTSRKDLEKVEFWITPRLNKYAAVEPESIDKVEKNKEYTIQIIVSLPSDIKTKQHIERNIEELLGNDIDKDDKDFLAESPQNKIHGLLFVKSQKTFPWFKFKKDKVKTIKIIQPKPLRIVINIKEPIAEVIPEKVTLPSYDRIEEDPAVGQDYIKDEIIVKFKDGTPETTIKQIVKDIDGVFIGFFEELGIYQLQMNVADFNELDQKIHQLEQNINVEFAGRQVVTIPTL